MSAKSEMKKQLVLKHIEAGDKRSYNELMADLELEIWTANFKGWDYVYDKKSNKKAA